MGKGKVFIAVFIVMALLGLLVPHQLKKQDSFCVSCHLPSGKKLHGKKHERFMAHTPKDLAGAHKSKSKEPLTCSSCHRGDSITLSARILWREVYNTAAHFVSSTEEPKEMDGTLMPDGVCVSCHALPVGERGKGYHGSDQHRPTVKRSCISCHPAHRDGAGKHTLNREAVLKECASCHPNLSPAFLAVLPDSFR